MLSFRIHRFHFDVLTIFLGFTTALNLAVSIWAIDKGFDFSDEAYSYLGFQNPAEIKHVSTYYVTLLTSLLGWLDLDIITVRIIKLILELICSSALAFGIMRIIRTIPSFSEINFMPLFLASFSGFFLFNATGSQMLTYNFMSSALLQLGIGLLFISISIDSQKKITAAHYFSYLAVGMIVFALFAVKFSNAILFLVPGAFFILICKSAKEIAAFLLLTAIGFFMLGFLVFHGQLFSWFSEYRTTLTSATDSTLAPILSKYLYDVQDIGRTLFLENLLIFLFCIASLIIIDRTGNKYLKLSLTVVFGVVVVVFAILNRYYLGGISQRYSYSLFYIFLAAVAGVAHLCLYVLKVMGRETAREPVLPRLVILSLLLIPLVGSLGTNNYLRMQVIMYMSSWFVSIFLLFYWIDKRFSFFMLVILSVNATAQSISGLVYSPYRIITPLTLQTQPLPKAVSGENIKLDTLTERKVEEIYTMIHEKTTYAAGMPMFSYRSEYGFIYLLKGVLPGWCWYKDEFQNFYCDCLRRSRVKDFEKMIFILPKDHQMDSTLVATFNQLHVTYPDRYKELGQIETIYDGVVRTLVVLAPEAILK